MPEGKVLKSVFNMIYNIDIGSDNNWTVDIGVKISVWISDNPM